MGDLKTSWPYIRFMTLADKAAYVSDLPVDNMDSLEVRPLITSPLFHIDMKNSRLEYPIDTADQRRARRAGTKNAFFWGSLYLIVSGIGLHSMGTWYYNSGMHTFMQFRAEGWGVYARRRLWPAVAVVWTIGHWVTDSSFTFSYPAVFSE